MNREEIRQILREELGSLIKSDRYVFEKLIQMADGRNFQFGKTTGTQLGTEAAQKIAFHGITPVIQANAISAPTGGATVDAEARTAINSIRTVLSDKGLTA